MNLTTNLTTTLLPDDKLKEIFDRLDLLQPGVIVPVNNSDNIPFIKQYIDCFKSVEFNSDYSKIRKLTKFTK